MSLTAPTLPMYPTPRDEERMQDDIRAHARIIAEHFEKIAIVWAGVVLLWGAFP